MAVTGWSPLRVGDLSNFTLAELAKVHQTTPAEVPGPTKEMSDCTVSLGLERTLPTSNIPCAGLAPVARTERHRTDPTLDQPRQVRFGPLSNALSAGVYQWINEWTARWTKPRHIQMLPGSTSMYEWVCA
jgi:hypothetical protein